MREKLEEFGLDARAFAGVKVAAVGEATAQALVDLGIRPDLVPSGQQSSEGLLADWAPYDDVFDPIDRVFLPRADIATDTLLAGLKDLGWAVDDVTAYRTVRAAPPPAETREALKGGGFDAVLFTSSSTVRNLVGIAGKPHDTTVLACIGPQTQATADELGLRVDVLSPKPDVATLVEALAEFAAAPQGRAAAERRAPPEDGEGGAEEVTASASRRRARAGCAVPRRCAGWSPTCGCAPADLVLPVFVKEGIAEPAPIASMPGVVQHTRESVKKAAHEAVAGRRRRADRVRHPGGQGRPRQRRRRPGRHRAARACRTSSPRSATDTVVMTDLCLDEYTDHGHCGLLTARRRGRQRRDAGALRVRRASRRRAPGRPSSRPAG